jgi:hypothetical protein
VHADFDGLPGLLVHIDLAARIMSDDHHGKARRQAMLDLEALHMAGNAAAQPFGKGLPVDDPGSHGSSVA